jgi:uncharacterized repeat protein (TIGR01451 family)
VTFCYAVTNTPAFELLGVAISDDGFGAIGTIASLGAGATEGDSHGYHAYDDSVHQGSAQGVDPFGNVRTCSPDDAAVNVVWPGIDVDKTVRPAGGSCPGADSATVLAGTEVVYCYEVTNTGDTAVYAVELEDDVLGFIGAIPVLASGASQTLSSGPVAIYDDVTNVVDASGRDEFGYPVSARDIAIVDALAADLRVVKTAPRVLNREETDRLTYTIVVSNVGDATAEGVVLVDPLPEDLTFLSATTSRGDLCAFADGVVTCQLGDLDPGDSVTVTIEGQVEILFGRLENEACAETPTPIRNPRDDCDDATTWVAPGDTRTIGAYGTHPRLVEQCLEVNGGAIDLGFVVLRNEAEDDDVDATVGGDDDCVVENNLDLAMGVLNANPEQMNDGTHRSYLESARMRATRQVLAAICNETLLGTEGGLDLDAAVAILAGDDADAIAALISITSLFNQSGDLIGLDPGVELGPADSSFPWDDPTDPYDPDDLAATCEPPAPPPATSSRVWDPKCGLGTELVLVLPYLMGLARRRRSARA